VSSEFRIVDRVARETRVQTICAAPSCWEDGEGIEIEGDSSRAPILCELHRRYYLGVST
jgi:hypothetical protein